MQNELVKVTTNEQGQQLVSGRELHEVLEIGTPFKKWIDRMIDYGFQENIDFTTMDIFVQRENSNLGNKMKDYILTLDMAKHIAMVQRSEIGMKVRNYFIECEKQLKNQKPQLTPMQQCALTILDDKADGVERVLALETFKKLSIQEGVQVGYSQGLKQLCKDGIVTIPEIISYIHDLYPEKFVYASEIISTEWSRYLKHMGYLHMVHFKRKNGFGMEDKPVYQPTQMFEEVFVEQGMAIIREIDERGKVEIKYTVELDKFLQTETFSETFFAFLDSKYTKFDKSIVSEEMSA